MESKQIIALVVMSLSVSGCASLAASTAGTFIGNIASDRVIKEMDKRDKDSNTMQERVRAGCQTTYMQNVQKNRRRDSKLVRLHTKRTQSCNATY